ncbi:hypothetical protein DICPUDRAFT_35564 [Dictyostelium purpureum]|uniref:C2 domain-containing protein n=1 Tax=Dictyostelium purpureum TaxID=5786 RepID=F0ZPG1_DICPU|nr:uncharacterized protein DICPUDRAFT_35564 [Dictyostelium purpureum]EGC34163.1 hypothetical protein DICPUDRAFT_35564 [Dictyostelium purpureum]|eukprot:XP_003289317.1 hypothetical protein DICPUDRAFT_35564 [Dictyostelium purpureum]
MASLKNKKGDIEVTLLETKGIKSGDIFIIIDLPPNKLFKTHTFKGPDPKIFEKFVLDLMTFQDDEILLIVKEQKPSGSKFIGQIQIPLKALNLPQGPQWYYLTDRPSQKEGQKPKIVTGSIQIQLNFVHRLIRAKSRVSIPKEFLQQTGVDGSNETCNITNSNSTTPSSSSYYSTTKSNSSSSSSTSTSSSRSTSPDPEKSLEVGFGYPVHISQGSNNSGCDILEVRGGESIHSKYQVQSLSNGFDHGHNTSSSITIPPPPTISDIDISKEEDLIIEETLKDKESIVKKQIVQQKELLNKLSETIKQLEKQGKPVVQEKAKLKKMQEDIDDMEKLIQSQTKQSTSPSSSSINNPSPITKQPSRGRNLLSSLGINKSTEKIQQYTPHTSTFNNPPPPTIAQSMNLIHASIHSNNTSGEFDQKLNYFIIELENERKLKESMIEKYKTIERDYFKLEKELQSTKQSSTNNNLTNKTNNLNTTTTKTSTTNPTKDKEYNDLLLKFKILEAENISLIQEKEILNEKYKLFEKESEKLEKELEYEQVLRKKEMEKKEFEREESKKLLKELEQVQNKEKLLYMELDTQKELADVMREKKQLFEREITRLEFEVKQLKSGHSSNVNPNVNKQQQQTIELLQSKVKSLENEIDLEKKSKSLIQDKLKLAEKDEKFVERLESEIKRLENHIKSLTNTNESLEKSKDKLKKEKEQLEKEFNTLKQQKNAPTLSKTGISSTSSTNLNTPKQIEEKLNEMVNILVNISQKPDSAAVASIADNKLFDTPLGKKIKDLSEKIQTATLKNKEMELQLEELRNSKIQSQIERHRQGICDSDNNTPTSSSLTSSSNSLNSYSSQNNSSSNLMALKGSSTNSSDKDLMQQQNNQISLLVSKLEKLDRLEEFMRKLDEMKTFQLNHSPMGGSAGGADQSLRKRTHHNMKSELEEIQKTILDSKSTEKEREDANVRFEKVFQELSNTEEYKREIQLIQDEKRRLNEPLNQKALQKLIPIYSNIDKQPLDIREKVKDNPELSLIGMDPKAILSKHQNDFQYYLLRSINLEELRAIRASLPKWRSDQKKQTEWTISLEEKIDQISKQQPHQQQQPKITRSKTNINLNIQKQKPQLNTQTLGGKNKLMKQESAHETLFNELLKKRSKII